jgi:hypothetical protein
MPDLITIGRLAVRLGVMEQRFRRFASKRPDLVPQGRVGTMRVFREEDIPAIREACVKAGLIRETATTEATNASA